jgi:hypothetical protein
VGRPLQRQDIVNEVLDKKNRSRRKLFDLLFHWINTGDDIIKDSGGKASSIKQ